MDVHTIADDEAIKDDLQEGELRAYIFFVVQQNHQMQMSVLLTDTFGHKTAINNLLVHSVYIVHRH